jgi:hypothetical protein
VIGVLFLELNGYRFTAREEDAAQAVLSLAAGILDEEEYTLFLRGQYRTRRRRLKICRTSRVRTEAASKHLGRKTPSFLFSIIPFPARLSRSKFRVIQQNGFKASGAI